VKLALAGDTMLGRGVAGELARRAPESLVDDELVAVAREADLFVLNLECCISDRGERWPDPAKPFFFRAPPAAVDLLLHLRVDCVTLANNHALDFGPDALLDTLEYLDRAGIACIGAGEDEEAARRPVTLEADEPLVVVAASDHPRNYAAAPGRPGIAFADLRSGETSDWLLATLHGALGDAVLVTPHWGPNMATEPVEHVRAAADRLAAAGATLVAGHSAHVFQGVAGRVLFDLGDFLDDYRVDPNLRNDLGLLWLVDLDRAGPRRLEAVPVKLDYCFTGLASGDDAAWIRRRFREACRRLGTDATEDGGRLVVTLQ
jgi:poly-gamma-glutamate capsule biosynthesis protein CapA/YwtB (metallophosphatase superfamily)